MHKEEIGARHFLRTKSLDLLETGLKVVQWEIQYALIT